MLPLVAFITQDEDLDRVADQPLRQVDWPTM
jgi:hypothetical protein